MKSAKRKYGWVRDKADFRDLRYTSIRHVEKGLSIPETVDLTNACPPVYDQGELGSCTANAIVAAYEYDQMKEGKVYTHLSRLFLYFNERFIEGTVDSDAGANIRDGIKSIGEKGICQEALCPYVPTDFKKVPSGGAFSDALNHQAVSYYSVVPNIRDIRLALADNFPVVFGFTVYESFESEETAKTGIMTLPKSLERCLGGHAVLMVGYETGSQTFLVRNSWGSDWGVKGYFWMPFSYLPLCSDFWVVQSVK